MHRLSREDFERIVLDSIESLPQEFLARLENVAVFVEDGPTLEQLRSNGLHDTDTLFGLYEGVPLTDRMNYSMVMPDRITIFQKSLEESCETEEDLVAEIQATVIHEVAHFFGIDDAELERLGLA